MKRKKRRKAEPLNPLRLLEVFVALTPGLAQGDIWRVRFASIHQAFAALKERHPRLMSAVEFSEHSLESYSRGLDRAVGALSAAGQEVYISSWRSQEYLCFGSSARGAFLQVYKELDTLRRRSARMLAREFEEELARQDK